MKRTKLLKTILVVDIRSSSVIVEELIKIHKFVEWADFLESLQNYINDNADNFDYELYKFTGDGWIIIFEDDIRGKLFVDFIKRLSIHFHGLIKKIGDNYLHDNSIELGLTFGLDIGNLIGFPLANKYEYVGEPINIACRLQNKASQNNKNESYKPYRGFISKRVYRKIENDLDDLDPKPKRVKLHNINDGRRFPCMLVTIPMN